MSSSAMGSARLWERGCGEHGKMWRNVIPGQCEARNSVLPLGTRPQAVCFCRDTLTRPRTYVNTERKDTHSQRSEPSRCSAETFIALTIAPSARLFHEILPQSSLETRDSTVKHLKCDPKEQHVCPRQLTPALSRAAHEFVGLCIPEVGLQVADLLVERPPRQRPALPPLKVQVLLLQRLVLGQLFLLFLQLLAMFEYHFVGLVERRRREQALTTHALDC